MAVIAVTKKLMAAFKLQGSNWFPTYYALLLWQVCS